MKELYTLVTILRAIGRRGHLVDNGVGDKLTKSACSKDQNNPFLLSAI